ncbi:hypothetical protein Mkiyose1665_00550 [Mycobacterium kiyosense]|uniref:Cytochrome P450 n=1 Tax=Mycobacterium kiyosense TaxID=2871094 RepID=A0A9P3Q0I0_9MYCO|nr:hypothetical protein IWGMT90018_47270 [Mycobacterium kiyosense]BDE15814.1 hypothetical protein MKCMC460_46740 [Mycobacterium sp. 20KCMC460]GLB80792.1 hypothetical protein SRL2020028_00480 [Mycobacterium kiyosense]GLB87470.1 hypothetical protein SRL2020130_02870 [Mycobacterium kiyosense]GLB93272.1 hypothetical protein SRL2020226_00480 [Mycobacterium kiyosense]
MRPASPIRTWRSGAAGTDSDPLKAARHPHLAFGGGGPQFCLGSHVAKLQLKAIVGELYRRLPDIETVGAPEYLTSTFINGIKRQYVRFTPESG